MITSVNEEENQQMQETNKALQREITKLENKITEYQIMINGAKEYIKDNSMGVGKKYKVIIDENNILEDLLTERVEI